MPATIKARLILTFLATGAIIALCNGFGIVRSRDAFAAGSSSRGAAPQVQTTPIHFSSTAATAAAVTGLATWSFMPLSRHRCRSSGCV